MAKIKKTSDRVKEIPEYKIKQVSDIAKAIEGHKTFLVASTRKLPSSQFHQIKKKLRGKAEIRVVKKSLAVRAIESVKSPVIKDLSPSIGADVALFFSDLNPFDLAGLLADSQSAAKAKAGDIAPEDINVEPGPTELVPGPAISELSGVGLKVAVEGGKLAIKQPATIAKQGDTIKDNVASVMGKLGILPMRVGFEPVAAYDSVAQKVYRGIKIDKKGTLDALREAIGKGRGFAISLKYVSPDTIGYFISKAGLEGQAIQALVDKQSSSTQTTTKEDN